MATKSKPGAAKKRVVAGRAKVAPKKNVVPRRPKVAPKKRSTKIAGGRGTGRDRDRANSRMERANNASRKATQNAARPAATPRSRPAQGGLPSIDTFVNDVTNRLMDVFGGKR